jgi:hypothetical protein
MNKIKHIKILFLVLACLCLFSSCSSPGWFTENTKIIIGESEKFSREEIEQAIEVVKQEENGIYETTLLSIRYDEAMSKLDSSVYLTHGSVKPENLIVLFSDFKTYGDQMVLQPYEVYTNYKWTLTRKDKDSPWVIISKGFG